MADRITVIPKKIVTVIEPHKSTLVDREKYRQTRVAAYCRVSTDSIRVLSSLLQTWLGLTMALYLWLICSAKLSVFL